MVLPALVFNINVQKRVEKHAEIHESATITHPSPACTIVGASFARAQFSEFQCRCYAAPVKVRLDKLLVDRALVPSRERAQAMILAGRVLVNDQKIDKAGAQVESDCAIRLLGEDLKYVSRGGLKLERALEHWKVDVKELVCLDVGA